MTEVWIFYEKYSDYRWRRWGRKLCGQTAETGFGCEYCIAGAGGVYLLCELRAALSCGGYDSVERCTSFADAGGHEEEVPGGRESEA